MSYLLLIMLWYNILVWLGERWQLSLPEGNIFLNFDQWVIIGKLLQLWWRKGEFSEIPNIPVLGWTWFRANGPGHHLDCSLVSLTVARRVFSINIYILTSKLQLLTLFFLIISIFKTAKWKLPHRKKGWSVIKCNPNPNPNRKSFIVDIFFNFTMFFKNVFIYCVFLYTWNT